MQIDCFLRLDSPYIWQVIGVKLTGKLSGWTSPKGLLHWSFIIHFEGRIDTKKLFQKAYAERTFSRQTFSQRVIFSNGQFDKRKFNRNDILLKGVLLASLTSFVGLKFLFDKWTIPAIY